MRHCANEILRSVARPRYALCGAIILERVMKPHIQNGETRPELLALTPVVALLTAAMLAKLGVIAELLHVVH